MTNNLIDLISRLDHVLDRVRGKAQGENRHAVNGAIDVARDLVNELRVALNETSEAANAP